MQYRKKINKAYFGVYSFIILVPIIVNFIWVVSLREYRSEFFSLPVKLSNFDVFGVLLVLIIGYFLIFLLYLYCDSKRIILSHNITFSFHRKKLEVFLFIYILANLVFYLKTGRGKAGASWESDKFSFIFNMFNIDFLMMIYYLNYRDQITKVYGFLILIFIANQLLHGWTGNIFIFFLFELFILIKKRKYKKYLIFIPTIFFIGSFFYQFIYPIKILVRYGYFEMISYGEAVIKLFERMSFFSHALVGLQNKDIIKNLYNHYGYNHTEIFGFFRPMVPSFIFKNKDFRSFGNLIMQSVYPDLPNSTSANMGFFSYFYNLINVSCMDFIIYICFFMILTFLYKLIVDMISPPPGDGNYYSTILVFYYFMSLFQIAALEQLYYGWFSIVYTYIFFVVVGIIKYRTIASKIEKCQFLSEKI